MIKNFISIVPFTCLIFALQLIELNEAGPSYCWDPTQTMIRTDGATLTFGAPGQITCPGSAQSCAVILFLFSQISESFKNEYILKNKKTLVGVGLGTCSSLLSYTNTQYVCMSNGCNQISSCWNPAASSTATAFISCPPTSSTSQTYACFVSEAFLYFLKSTRN